MRDISKLTCFFEKTYTALEEWIIRTYRLMSGVRISQVFCLWLVQLHLRLGRASGSVSQDGYVFTSRVKEEKPFFRPPAAKITLSHVFQLSFKFLPHACFFHQFLTTRVTEAPTRSKRHSTGSEIQSGFRPSIYLFSFPRTSLNLSSILIILPSSIPINRQPSIATKIMSHKDYDPQLYG